MKALILSAGYGTRLNPLTSFLPKPMFPILDRSVFSIIAHNLDSIGIREIGVNLYHLSDKMAAHIRHALPLGTKAHTVVEHNLMGTGGAISEFRDFVGDEPFLAHNCDVVTDISLNRLVESHQHSKAIATLLLVDNTPTDSVAVSPSGEIIDIGGFLGQGDDTELHTFSGIAVFSKEMFDYLPENSPSSLIDAFLEMIRKHPGSVRGIFPDGEYYWRDIGTLPSYLDLHRDILIERSYRSEFISIPEGSVYIGLNTMVNPLSHIEGFASIGYYSEVPKAAHIKDIVIWPGTILPKGFRAERAVVYRDLTVEE